MVKRFKGIVSYAEINDEIYVELKNSLKFYGPKEFKVGRIPPYLTFAEWRLGISDENFLSFICVLLEIFYFKIYEQFYKPLKNDVVVDAGAFVGMFAVKAAKAVGDNGKVIAVEPEKENLKFLKKNVEENGLENIIIVEKGLWSEKGKKRLYLDYRSAASLVYCRDRFVEVEVDTLDNIISDLQLSVDYIKMDVEGAEIEALKGAEKVLNKDLRIVIGAYHEINGEQAYNKVIPFLEERGFIVKRTGGIVHATKVRNAPANYSSNPKSLNC